MSTANQIHMYEPNGNTIDGLSIQDYSQTYISTIIE